MISQSLERPRVDRARATQVRRLVRGERLAERLVAWAVPDRLRACGRHAAKIETVRRGDHAAGHGQALVTDVRATPRPVTALGPGVPGACRRGRVRGKRSS